MEAPHIRRWVCGARRSRVSTIGGTDQRSSFSRSIGFGMGGIALRSPNRVIDRVNPPPKGALESVEIDSLASSLAILTGESERRDDICRQVQTEARKSAQVLAQVLPELIRRRYGS